MAKHWTLFYLAIFLATKESCSLPTPTENPTESINHTKNIQELVNKQAETIKQIVTQQQIDKENRHKSAVNLQYPVVTKHDASETTKPEPSATLDGLSIDELREKCKLLQKLLDANSTNKSFQTIEKKNDYISNVHYQSSNPQRLPIFQNRKIATSTFNYKQYGPYGFYITTETPSVKTTTTTTTTTTPVPPTTTTETPDIKKPAENIKYIRLEPVILQKTFLSDGRIVYYWHKSLPSSVHYVTTAQQNENVAQPEALNAEPATTQFYYNTEAPTTSTSSGFGFKSFFPFYSSDYYQKTTEATSTTEKPSTTSTTTETIEQEPQFAHQLRFVVPVPYSSLDTDTAQAPVRQPWDFDQFAYYPKGLQPSTVNMQMPYVPTFHMIRGLAVPNKEYGVEQGPRGYNDNFYDTDV